MAVDYFDNAVFCREIVGRVGYGVMTLGLFALGVTNCDMLGAWQGLWQSLHSVFFFLTLKLVN